MRRNVPLLLAALAVGCGAGSDAPDAPIAPEPAKRPSHTSVPRSAYADCVVKLRGTTPDPADFAIGEFREAAKAEVRGDFEGAIGGYADFVTDHAGSKFVPYAYFALGIIYEHLAESDSDRWILAEQSFNAVLKYTSELDVVTYVELAKVFNARTKYSETLSSANRAADRMRAAPRTPCVDVALPVLADHLVTAYAETGDPSRAFTAFRRFYGAQQIDDARLLTERLAALYDKRGDATSATTARSGVTWR